MPLLALESTVIAHGLPFPQNLETARALEATARLNGAEPRTIAVIGGKIKIGLDESELDHLARSNTVLKLSRRDIAFALTTKADGATTVSATMFLAYRAGIRVFATGGIGGIHRAIGGGPAWDVSADLTELATTPVAVVCAGAKAILDLPATLEYLETHSVPVIGYQTDEFPAFYSRSSGLGLTGRVQSGAEAATFIRTHWQLGNSSAVLVCVPVPAEYEIPRREIEPAIARVLEQAREQGIAGPAVTPFLLRKLSELTGGRSVQSNMALLKNNVAIAARIARELDKLESTKLV